MFTSLRRLYSTLDEAELARRISDMPCLIAFARAESFAEGVQFLDHINELRALERPLKSKKMFLILMTQETIDETLLQNKTNHFNVHMINQGKNISLETTDQGEKSVLIFQADLTVTSLCPALGERYPLIISGMCPSSLQEPYGKEIPVAVLGVAPYVLFEPGTRNWPETKPGAEFDNIKVWEKKFGFKAKLLNVGSYDKSDPPGQVFSVGNIYTNHLFNII